MGEEEWDFPLFASKNWRTTLVWAKMDHQNEETLVCLIDFLIDLVEDLLGRKGIREYSLPAHG